ncbi:hypothetical protein Sjap_011058 [Stephania japonica]|uniref:Uncharacterized protein n=1 Tax=Stephania japonica TaxID=461633 RepID=A0AAP0P7R5_9MAGN
MCHDVQGNTMPWITFYEMPWSIALHDVGHGVLSSGIRSRVKEMGYYLKIYCEDIGAALLLAFIGCRPVD